MNKKLPALFALCLLAFASTAAALQTDELVAITTMPLAVADAVALPAVPVDPFMTVVTTLNRAAVPAPQFVEIVRYAPVALVQPADPPFVTYVTQQYQSGIVGEPLALTIARQYDAYGIPDVDVINPPVVTTRIVERQILPQVVVTRFQPVEFDPLAVVAMPLAVAAVADLVDVPRTDLFRFVSSLNQALVPAPQFVEIVRYSPVVLVDPAASPQFVQFVTTEIDRGVIGTPLAFAIVDRFQTIEHVAIDLAEPQRVFIADRDVILPPVVVNRVHPHGGPPGQLKKQLGLQTGAEVVHGTMPSRTARVRSADRVSGERKIAPRKTRSVQRVERPRAASPRVIRVKPREQRRVVVQPSVKTHGKPAPQMQPAPQAAKPQGGGNKGGGGQQGNQGGGKGKGKGKG